EIRGDETIEITGAAGIPDACEKDITFLSGLKLIKELRKSRAAAVLVEDFIPELEKAQVKTKNPLYAFAKLLSHFYVKRIEYRGISKNAFVSGEAEVAPDVSIFDFSYISGGVKSDRGLLSFPA